MKLLKKCFGYFVLLIIIGLISSAFWNPFANQQTVDEKIKSYNYDDSLADYYQTEAGIEKYWENEIQKRDDKIAELEAEIEKLTENNQQSEQDYKVGDKLREYAGIK